ncbi:MAG: Na/Pi cotransporter family protein [Lachnospiraceae bacterium]|nr:Na/Pi cotransporter family protein [Lachnospiraceae bacterium]MDD7665760.1 Na/Pi cotransporter family protein [Lachnospiraceae bacterium]MDY4165765.1 Na/Pi cotransporter family protein [Lachnospiraceae bacterium]
MSIFDVLSLLGGLALFLYGMEVMGDSLSKMAGGKLESILERLTKKRIYAVLLGAGVTAIIQSSSATTVMVVGFVNSGIMKLSQAVGVIMGANIGTTVTSWLLSLTGISGDSLLMQLLKPTSFTPVLAAIGIILILFTGSESKKKDIGTILLGFAVLMYGMEAMSGAVSGLADDPNFTSLMTTFSNPFIGLIVGTVLTAIIQSSSASVGILQALCATGAVNYSVAIPIIMGQNIGTCVTCIISSFGANRNAKRAAMIHLYFNLIGTMLFMIVFYSLNHFIDFAFLNTAANPAGIAVIHSGFNIGATIVLLPFADKLVKLAELTIPDKKEDRELAEEKKSIAIDERFLTRPAFAMELCRGKAREMAEVSVKAISLSLETLLDFDEDKAAEVRRLEDEGDEYEDVLGTYLVKLSSQELSSADSKSLSLILHSISDFERISDHAIDVVMSAEEIHKKKLEFTKHAREEIETLSRAINDICEMTKDSFCKDDLTEASHVEPLEEVIDTLTKQIKENHIKRLRKGKCSVEIGFILEDILTWLERVSDHCSNIALEMLTIYDNDYNTHEYLKSFSQKEQADFEAEYDELIKKYPIK